MAEITLQTRHRTLQGKKVRRLRRQGIIPANVYGGGGDSLAVQLDVRALRDALTRAGGTTVITMRVVGDGAAANDIPVLIEHVSRHPASGEVLHVDFRRVDLSQPVRAAVPITLTGEAPAVNLGGVLMQLLDTLDIEALPANLPPDIEVDVSGLAEIDAQITVADLPLPSGVTAHTAPDTLVAKVVASKVAQEIEAEAVEAAEAAAAPAPEAEAPVAETEPQERS